MLTSSGELVVTEVEDEFAKPQSSQENEVMLEGYTAAQTSLVASPLTSKNGLSPEEVQNINEQIEHDLDPDSEASAREVWEDMRTVSRKVLRVASKVLRLSRGETAANAPDGPDPLPNIRPTRGPIVSDSDEIGEELSEYLYENLKGPNSIRVINLRPGVGYKANEIVCQLFEVDVDTLMVEGDANKTRIEYEAVSWAWGGDPWEDRIRIRTKGDDFYFRVPYSLASALRTLRSRRTSRMLWIDAICINQRVINEKNMQIPMISKIYGKARRLCIWLGPGDDESKVALDFVKREVLRLQDFDKLCDDPDATPKWNALLNLMKRPWFSKRWVVQEIALANDAVIYCGKEMIPWRDFADARPARYRS